MPASRTPPNGRIQVSFSANDRMDQVLFDYLKGFKNRSGELRRLAYGMLTIERMDQSRCLNTGLRPIFPFVADNPIAHGEDDFKPSHTQKCEPKRELPALEEVERDTAKALEITHPVSVEVIHGSEDVLDQDIGLEEDGSFRIIGCAPTDEWNGGFGELIKM